MQSDASLASLSSCCLCSFVSKVDFIWVNCSNCDENTHHTHHELPDTSRNICFLSAWEHKIHIVPCTASLVFFLPAEAPLECFFLLVTQYPSLYNSSTRFSTSAFRITRCPLRPQAETELTCHFHNIRNQLFFIAGDLFELRQTDKQLQ